MSATGSLAAGPLLEHAALGGLGHELGWKAAAPFRADRALTEFEDAYSRPRIDCALQIKAMRRHQLLIFRRRSLSCREKRQHHNVQRL